MKKYRYDYLVHQNGKALSFKMVCYADEFEIDQTSKKEFNQEPENVNQNKDIKERAKEVVTKAIREIVTKHLDNIPDNNVLSAKNFISKNYKNTDKKASSVFEIVKEALHMESNAFLLKSSINIDNMGYLYDDNDSKTNYILKQLDWKNLYCVMPSMLHKSNEEVFNTNKESMTTLLDKISYRTLEPASLDMNIEVNEENINKFLQKKSKRQRKEDLSNSKIPSRIKELMKQYGDVLANVGKSDIDKYKKHKIYSEIY